MLKNIIMHQQINICSKNDINILNKKIKIIVNNPADAKFIRYAHYFFIKNITIETKINDFIFSKETHNASDYLLYELAVLEKDIENCPSDKIFDVHFPLCYKPEDSYFQWFSHLSDMYTYFIDITIEFADFDDFLLEKNDALTFDIDIV